MDPGLFCGIVETDHGRGTSVAGIAVDFQYVSTAPPTSRVTPENGVIIFRPNVTYKQASISKNFSYRHGMTYLSDQVQFVIQNWEHISGFIRLLE